MVGGEPGVALPVDRRGKVGTLGWAGDVCDNGRRRGASADADRAVLGAGVVDVMVFLFTH